MPPLSPTAIPPHALAEASRSGPCRRPCHRYAACRDAACRLHDSRATRTAKLQRARVAKATPPSPRRHTAANLDHATAQSTIPPHALAEASRSGPCHRPFHRSVPPPFRRMRSLKLRAPDHATAATPPASCRRRANRTAKLQRARVAKAAAPRPRRHTAANPERIQRHATAPIPPHALAEASRSGPCRRPCHRSVPPPFRRMRSLKLRAPDHATAMPPLLRRLPAACCTIPAPPGPRSFSERTPPRPRPHSTACAR
jgi:hypothetical protein